MATLKLSDAIRLGSTLGPQAFGSFHGRDDSTCALSAAEIAIGSSIPLFQEWPWLKQFSVCPECKMRRGGALSIIHLNDDHHWTRERIADWIATIEPAEVHASETIREVQYGQVPKRTTPEVETFVTITK